MSLDNHIRSAHLKRQVNLNLYEHEIDILDALCARYNCGRPAIISALLEEHKDDEKVFEDVKPGRRPGGGRKPGR